MHEPARPPRDRPTASALALAVLAGSTLAAALAAPLFAEPQTHAGHGDHAHHQQMLSQPADAEVTDQNLRAIPDVRLVDQDGREVRFYSDLVAGKVVAMNFIFTTCTTICPPMGAIFGQLQQHLGDRVGRDVHLISVSVDPVTDTPERLKAWSHKLGGGPGWTLVTGPKADVDQLLKTLQVFTPDFVDHSPTVLVGNDATRTWRRAYGLAPVATLAGLIDEMASQGSGDDREAGR